MNLKATLFSVFFMSFGFLSAQEINLFLIGDAGLINDHSKNIFNHLEASLIHDSLPSHVIILGDNCYPNGISDSSTKAILKHQLDALNYSKGLKLILPGNHDWDRSGSNGLNAVKKQEAFVEAYGDSSILFTPDAGTPGPEVFNLSEDVVLVAIDTQWWLHKGQKNTDCKNCSESSFLQSLDSILIYNKNKKIIVAGHHPLYSLGQHGIHYSLKDHMRPFPIVGSLIVLVKWLGLDRQSISHPKYKKMKRSFVAIFEKHLGLIYVCGHDHSLQYLRQNDNHYIISGAAAKSTFAKRAKEPSFTYEGHGYMRLTILEKTCELTFINEEGKEIKTIDF